MTVHERGRMSRRRESKSKDDNGREKKNMNVWLKGVF